MVKRYAMMTVLSLIYMSPNAQVSPNRQSRAIAPITQDLVGETKQKNKKQKKRKERDWFFVYKRRHMSANREGFGCGFSKKKTAYQYEL